MKNKKLIVSLVAAVVAVTSAVAALIIFRDQIKGLLNRCTMPKEFEDYADLE